MKALITTIKGIEELAVAELTRIFSRLNINVYSVDLRKGRGRAYLHLRVDESKVAEILGEVLSEARLIERFIVILAEGELEEIRRAVKERLARLLTPWTAVGVRAERIRGEELRSPQLASLLGRLIQEECGWIPVSLDAPDLQVYCEIEGKLVRVGIDLAMAGGLHKRLYRLYVHPAMLNPIIANAMCELCGLEGRERVLDPMCGSGTILIECKLKYPRVEAYGFDINSTHIEGAKLNSKAAGVSIRFEVADVCEVASLFPEQFFDAIMTNPPYGIRERAIGGLRRVYTCLVEAAYKLLKEGGKLCVITPRRKLLLSRISMHGGFKVKKMIDIEEGGLKSTIILLEKNT